MKRLDFFFMKRLDFFLIPWIFTLLEGFQPEYAYEDIEGNWVSEEHPETQDQKGNFVVKTNSLYNILIAVKMHTMRIPKESAVCIKLANLLYFWISWFAFIPS